MTTRDPEFTWGDEVRVVAHAPAEMRPGAIGCVVVLDAWPDSPALPDGSRPTYFVVEFSDGKDATIPETLLERF